jgi:hypothetical protein
MENLEKSLVEGLLRNEIKEENINLFSKLKKEAEKLGFEFAEYDGIDGDFLVTFYIKN